MTVTRLPTETSQCLLDRVSLHTDEAEQVGIASSEFREP